MLVQCTFKKWDSPLSGNQDKTSFLNKNPITRTLILKSNEGV